MLLRAFKACTVRLESSVTSLAAGDSLHLYDLDPDKLGNIFDLINDGSIIVDHDEDTSMYSFNAIEDPPKKSRKQSKAKKDVFTNTRLRSS